MSYADLSSELAGHLPGLSAFLADDYIKRAWRKIRDARVWSFLMVDDSIVFPAQVSAGTLAITSGLNTVTANATASAALLAMFGVPVPAEFLSLRWGSGVAASEIYNIVSVDQTVPTAIVITLDRAVVETTNATSQYYCYRPYVGAPVSDFLKWTSVVDMVNGWTLYTKYDSSTFDRMDPQRMSFGPAYALGYYKASSDTPPVPMYEAWPGPTSGQTLYVRYRRRGADFSAPDDVQPDVIPDDLIMQAALAFYAYPWAMANPGHFPAMKGINWMQLIVDGKRTYFAMLQDAKRQDDNTSGQNIWNVGHGLRNANPYPYPVDASFLQSHLLPLP